MFLHAVAADFIVLEHEPLNCFPPIECLRAASGVFYRTDIRPILSNANINPLHFGFV